MEGKMKIFIDTEFTEFQNMGLISLGLVAENGQKFYLENKDYKKEWCSDFVKIHILPLLYGKEYAKSEDEIAQLFKAWVESFQESVLIVGDYAGDWKILERLMGNNAPSNLQGFINVFNLLAHELADKLNVQSLVRHEKLAQEVDLQFRQTIQKWFVKNKKMPHHALDDALSNIEGYLVAHNFIQNLTV